MIFLQINQEQLKHSQKNVIFNSFTVLQKSEVISAARENDRCMSLYQLFLLDVSHLYR